MTNKQIKTTIAAIIEKAEAVAADKGIRSSDFTQTVRDLNGRSAHILFNVKYHFNQPRSDRYTKAELIQTAQDILTAAKSI